MQPRFSVSFMNIPNHYQQEQIEINAFESSASLFDLEGGQKLKSDHNRRSAGQDFV